MSSLLSWWRWFFFRGGGKGRARLFFFSLVEAKQKLTSTPSPPSPRTTTPTKQQYSDVGDLLKLVFVPDYNVSTAECLIPAAELSQHISTAGTEASGTSNMKFQMNGCLIIGTMDGANVEIAEEIGAENMFVFGATADQVPRLRAERATFRPSPAFNRAVELVRSGAFGWEDYFAPMLDAISGGSDYYLVANDFDDYVKAQEKVDAAYRDEAGWARKSILSTAGSGKFSTDRTIGEYASEIWGVKACKVPAEGEV